MSLLLLTLACALDQKLGATDADPPIGDTADTSAPVDTATDTHTGDTAPDSDTAPDTSVETGPPPACPEREFPAEVIAVEPAPASTPVDWTPDTRLLTEEGSQLYSPVVARLVDTDGDGALTEGDVPLVVTRNEWNVLAVRGDDGSVVWEATEDARYPEYAVPAITELDGDGWPDVVVAGPGFVAARDGRDGSLKWRVAYEWLRRGCDTVLATDLDGDGTGEIVVGGAVFDGDGAFLGGATAGYGATTWSTVPGAADLDLDGPLEVLTGLGLYDSDGDIRRVMVSPTDGAVAAGQFDADLQGEVVVVNEGVVVLGDFDGSIHWTVNLPEPSNGAPLVADLDGRPGPEIGVAMARGFIVLDATGATLWTALTSDESSWYTAATAFDFDADGASEVVYADEYDLYVLDGATGAVLMKEPLHASPTACEQPVVADVDGDDRADIVYANAPYDGGTEVGIYVTTNTSWPDVPGVWNQYAYVPTYVDALARPVAAPPMTWTVGDDLYRAQANPAGPGPGANLRAVIADVCLDECADDALTVWLQVENDGHEDVTAPFGVELRGQTDAGEMVLGSVAWAEPVPSGQRSASVAVRVEPVERPLYAVSAAVDTTGLILERHEDDNVVAWEGVVCP